MAAKNIASDYEGRIRRAERLEVAFPFAQEVLAFYKRIAEFQKIVRAHVSSGNKSTSEERANGKDFPAPPGELHIATVLPLFPNFLKLVVEHGPSALAVSAQRLSNAAPEPWTTLLQDYWNTRGRDENPNAAFEQFLPRAFLQPYAEDLATEITTRSVGSADGHSVNLSAVTEGSGAPAGDQISGAPSLCPLCGARPLLGVLRQEGDGGKRFLLCSFCLQEWQFRRIFCPTCGEETEAKLPVYVAEQFPYIRVEACDTCKFYIRTIDLTKDGNAVPLVDDLAAIPLSLWAEEHSYSRAHPNLFGT